ncbi:MAG: aerotolerance regulator BatA [Flavipsychrobacter sp.]|jgi:Ca-activated chloride channel family protein|nr:aerotolerance regulator BatA [Flavipsychrobacter sp.]
MSELLDWDHISFAQPYFFALLLLIPFMVWWQLRGRRDNPALRLTTLSGLNVKAGGKATFRPVLFVLRCIALVALTIALARPQSSNTTENIDSEGIDIVISMDVSGSMLAEDFKPNRIEAAKSVALDFVDKRPTDRIGLVIFSGESFSMCPITIDHNVLKEQISQIKNGMLNDGTSIGMGLATAVDRLRYSKGKSKVIVLMTDGVNNTGLIDPLTALEIAKAFKIKIYTIGVGTIGQAIFPVQTPMGIQKQMQPVEIDEPLLKKMAAETGGRYYRATGNKALDKVYQEIDKLEKTKIDITSYKHYAELFFPFAMLAVICLVLEVLLRYTVFRSIT